MGTRSGPVLGDFDGVFKWRYATLLSPRRSYTFRSIAPFLELPLLDFRLEQFPDRWGIGVFLLGAVEMAVAAEPAPSLVFEL